MQLTTEQSYDLLAKHGCYVTEACDKCGQLLGPVRYTRKGESGAGQFPPPKDAHPVRRMEFPAYCSRECRDGAEAHTPGTCKGCGARLPEGKRRGSLFCDDTCRQNAHRVKDCTIIRDRPRINTGDFAPVLGV